MPESEPTADDAAARHAPAQPPTYDFDRLAEDSVEIHIIHGGHVYRLRQTKKGGLILTK